MTTIFQMCEEILASPDCPAFVRAKYPTPQLLYEYSPHGELFDIFFLYLRVVKPTIMPPDPLIIGSLRGADGKYEAYYGDGRWMPA